MAQVTAPADLDPGSIAVVLTASSLAALLGALGSAGPAGGLPPPIDIPRDDCCKPCGDSVADAAEALQNVILHVAAGLLAGSRGGTDWSAAAERLSMAADVAMTAAGYETT